MVFQTRQASYANLDALADVLVRAHINDPLFQQLFGMVPHKAMITWYADAFKKTWQSEWIRYYKIVETETGEIIAMSRFHYPRIQSEGETAGEIDYYGPLPEGANTALCKKFYDQLDYHENKHVDREKTYFVYFLSTLPEYQRQGLGKQLIDICLEDAATANAMTFLIATEAGSGLYRKLGFREIDSLTFDSASLGGEKSVSWLCMLRKPDEIK